MARPIKPEYLQAAFQAMAWEGWTFEAAMADPTRKAIVSWRARQICNNETLMRRYVVRPAIRRIRPELEALVKQIPPAAFAAATAYDCKRAAAGDRDD